jgi:hypothetical protein
LRKVLDIVGMGSERCLTTSASPARRMKDRLGRTAVELFGIGVLLEVLRACDSRWGSDAVLVAARDNAAHMRDVEEEGGNGGAQDEAVIWSACYSREPLLYHGGQCVMYNHVIMVQRWLSPYGRCRDSLNAQVVCSNRDTETRRPSQNVSTKAATYP